MGEIPGHIPRHRSLVFPLSLIRCAAGTSLISAASPGAWFVPGFYRSFREPSLEGCSEKGSAACREGGGWKSLLYTVAPKNHFTSPQPSPSFLPGAIQSPVWFWP